MSRITRILSGVLLLAGPASPAAAQSTARTYDLLITGGHVLDGSGNPWFKADVGVRDGRIVAVGNLAGATAGRTVDATGRIVSPGFIDVHSHADDTNRGAAVPSVTPTNAGERRPTS